MARGKLVKPLSQEIVDKFTENSRKQNRTGHPWKQQPGALKGTPDKIQCRSCGIWKRPSAFSASGQPCHSCRKLLEDNCAYAY